MGLRKLMHLGVLMSFSSPEVRKKARATCIESLIKSCREPASMFPKEGINLRGGSLNPKLQCEPKPPKKACKPPLQAPQAPLEAPFQNIFAGMGRERALRSRRSLQSRRVPMALTSTTGKPMRMPFCSSFSVPFITPLIAGRRNEKEQKTRSSRDLRMSLESEEVYRSNPILGPPVESLEEVGTRCWGTLKKLGDLEKAAELELDL